MRSVSDCVEEDILLHLDTLDRGSPTNGSIDIEQSLGFDIDRSGASRDDISERSETENDRNSMDDLTMKEPKRDIGTDTNDNQKEESVQKSSGDVKEETVRKELIVPSISVEEAS